MDNYIHSETYYYAEGTVYFVIVGSLYPWSLANSRDIPPNALDHKCIIHKYTYVVKTALKTKICKTDPSTIFCERLLKN